MLQLSRTLQGKVRRKTLKFIVVRLVSSILLRLTKLSDNEREVTVTLRMHAAVLVLFMPMYIASLITLILFPFAYLLAYIGFVRPSRKLKDAIINIVSDDVPHSYHEENEEQKIN